MRKIIAIIISTRTSLVLLIAFAVAIAAATFIEDRYDTSTSKLLIYNAKWFELLMILLGLNFIGNIGKYQLFTRKKFSSFLLHFAFVLMLIAAAVTRYTGYEGIMPIREGNESNIYYSNEPYFIISVANNDYQEIPFYFSEYFHNPFTLSLATINEKPIEIKFKNYEKFPGEAPDNITVTITYGNSKKDVVIPGKPDQVAGIQKTEINGISLNLGYGLKQMQLPFSLRLNDFVLERYPGSNSPSSYESAVTLIDPEHNISKDYKIYMNHVLDYNGYRFFQSSYDPDERGTILSVNHDFWGTWLTYLSYIFLSSGMLLSFLSRSSRFYSLFNIINSLREKRKSLLAVFIGLIVCLPVIAENTRHISKAHSEKLGSLPVQGYDGRIQPVHTLAYDVLHKITRKDNIEIKGLKMDAMNVFADMLVNPEYWKKQKIIYIRENSVKEAFGITETYASFDDFFDSQNNYKLQGYAETVFRKKPAEQNSFDKEIIKLDERINIMLMALQGDLLKIFPGNKNENQRWISWNEPASMVPLEGHINIINEEMNLPVFNYNNLFRLYYTELLYSLHSENYSRPEKILEHIENIQRGKIPGSVMIEIPSKKMIAVEMHYNQLHIFENLQKIYGVLSLLLILPVFIENQKRNKNRFTLLSQRFLIFIAVLSFAAHTYGLGLRWYLTGHAPWSNGYETLLLIAWSGLLAGFFFMKYAKVVIAATTLLAFFSLMTAGHSSYDPQLTQLQPVLKSYWLIFHVAALAISYGFFGLGFILGLINLVYSLFIRKANYRENYMLLKEWTYLNEIILFLGLGFAIVGTFLGAVWANESWGRYWGWDAKETWALVIILTYAIILHLKFIPKLNNEYLFNVAAVIGFSSVLMTFFGVNYYLSKGLHSYASGDTPAFPLWAWLITTLIIMLFIASGVKKYYYKNIDQHNCP